MNWLAYALSIFSRNLLQYFESFRNNFPEMKFWFVIVVRSIAAGIHCDCVTACVEYNVRVN